jgi:hypothetical protein
MVFPSPYSGILEEKTHVQRARFFVPFNHVLTAYDCSSSTDHHLFPVYSIRLDYMEDVKARGKIGNFYSCRGCFKFKMFNKTVVLVVKLQFLDIGKGLICGQACQIAFVILFQAHLYILIRRVGINHEIITVINIKIF